MNYRQSLNRLVVLAGLVVGLGADLSVAHAASYTWTNTAGGASDFWTNGINWGMSSGNYPGSAAGGSAYLTNQLSGTYTNILDTALANSINLLAISNALGEVWLVVTNGAANPTILTNTIMTLGSGGQLELDNDGAVTGITSFTWVGTNGTIYLNNGGKLFTSGSITIGSGASGVTGLVTSVSGPSNGGVWNLNSQTLTIGTSAATGNVLAITGGIVTNVGTVMIGNTASAVGNSLAISNGGEFFSGALTEGSGGSSYNVYNVGGGVAPVTVSNGLLTVGATSSGNNQMTVTNAQLWSMGLTLGNSSSNNLVAVNAGVTWNVLGGTITIGNDLATGNVLTINAGVINNVATLTVGIGSNANGNSVLITNGGQMFAGAVVVVSNNNEVLVSGGGLLEANSLSNSGNTISNVGGIYQFTTNKPIISLNGVGNISINNGTISFRAISNANVYGNWGGANGSQLANITFSGNNTFQLNAASNTAASVSQIYTFDTNRGSTNYVNLVMANGQTAYGSGALTIGTGGSVLISNTTAAITGLFTNNGMASAVNSLATFNQGLVNAGTMAFQNATINGGITNLSGGTVQGSGTITGDIFLNAGTLALASGQTIVLNGLTLTNTATSVLLGNSGTLLFNAASFFNDSTNNLAWNLGNGSTVVFSNGVNLLSAASLDSGAGFASTNNNFFMAQLNLAGGAQLNLATNATGHTAFYVGTLTLASGTTLNLDGLDVYYSALNTNGATVNLGGGELVVLGELPPQLLGWWQFDEGDGTTATDSSSVSNTATLFNSPAWFSGVFSNALAFDTNQWVSVPALPVYNLTKAISLSVWLYLPSYGGPGPSTVFGKGDGVTDGWALGLTDGLAVTFAMTATNGNTLTAPLPVPTNMWTHVVTTFDGTNAAIYQNGMLVTNQTWTGDRLVNTNGLVIGNAGSNGVAFALDDVRLYNYALNTNQIAALYNASTAGDGLPNWWAINYGLNPNDPTVATQTNANPWAHGLTNLQVYQNPSVLIADNYSTLNDGLPDWWKVSDGLSLTDSNAASAANTNLSWANGTNNLAAYQLSLIPPTITATITPTPNAAGWNNTNVVVHFSASSTGSGISWITSDITITGATNDCELTGYAMDNAGNLVSAGVLVNIDRTPPVITLDPGNGATVDLSNPWLTMQFSDPASNTVSAGLNSSSLTITMDGLDVTTNFFLSANGAVGDASAAPTGWHTNIISIADAAGNVTSATNTFYATGAVNPDAPTLANCNLAGGIVAPDSGLLWIQAEPSQTTNVSVVASVNGGTPIPFDLIGQTAGGFVQVDPSVTNVIVLYVTKTGDTTQSTAVRSRRRKSSLLGVGGSTGGTGFPVPPSPGGFHCEITSPGLDTFANGQPKTVTGVVTPTAYTGTINETNVVSVTVNGVATTLSTTMNADSYLTFTTVTPVPVAEDGSSTPVNGTVCLANGQCFTIPLAVLEGYEILKKRVSYRNVNWDFDSAPNAPWAGICPNNWSFVGCDGDWFQSAFDASTGTESVVDLEVGTPDMWSPTNFYFCASIPIDALKAQLSVTGTNGATITPAILPSSLGLTFGTSSYDHLQTFYNSDPNNPPMSGDISWSVDYPAGESNSITFRAPQKYKNSDGSPTTVLFTFEGMSYATGPGDTMNLSNVTFVINGESYAPAVVSGNDVSYIIPLQGGSTNTIQASSFTWSAATTSTTSWGDPNSYFIVYSADTTAANTLSFTGFHNGLLEIAIPSKEVLRDTVVANFKVKLAKELQAQDRTVALEVIPGAMKTQNLGSRGAVQMYDFGIVVNGQLQGASQVTITPAEHGEKSFSAIFNKEGKLKIHASLVGGTLKTDSAEITVVKQVRKYARLAASPNYDLNQFDAAFAQAASTWGNYYRNPSDSDMIKAIGMIETKLNLVPHQNRPDDIMTIGNPGDPALVTLQHTPNHIEPEVDMQNPPSLKDLNYPQAAASPPAIDIYWATCWLYHKAQKVNPPVFGGWRSWTEAVQHYGPGGASYLHKVQRPWQEGLWPDSGNTIKLWPIKIDGTPR